MKRYTFILLFLAAFLPFTAHAKSQLSNFTISVPTSPQAAAFKMYGDVAVNPAMGVPDISIHLFDIVHHGFQLPLSLKYNPTPFHPGYNYDVFGRGWALSVSSCISRNIECMPDETTGFELDTDQFGKLYKNITETTLTVLNLKYDLFTATLPDGSSFDFVIRKKYDGSTEYVVSGGRDVKISHTGDRSKIFSFKVVDEQGIEYSFDGADTTFAGPGSTITPYGTTFVSWQLTSIRLPHSAEQITLVYGKSIRSNFGRQLTEQAVCFHQSEYGATSARFLEEVTYSTLSSQYAYQMKLLTSISYGSTSIHIDYQDGNNSDYYNYARSISIRDGDELVREIKLDQHQGTLHYTGSGGLPFSTLDSVTILGRDGTSSEVYQCGYTSYSANFGGTDHWGNLNHHNYNYGVACLNLFVSFDVSAVTGGFVRDASKNADDPSAMDKVRISQAAVDTRTPASASQNCLLNKLTYPSGGYTEFHFENHEFFTQTSFNGDYIHDKKRREKAQATGFRICDIINYTADGVRSDSKHYSYGKTYHEEYGWPAGYDIHTNAGEPTVDPTIETYMSYQSSAYVPMSVRNMVLGLDPKGNDRFYNYNPFKSYTQPEGPNFDWEWECTFSAFNFRRVLNGRPAVVYPEVTVYYQKNGKTGCEPENCNGKTVYKYDIYEETQYDTAFFEKPEYFDNVLSYEGEKYRYNLLKEKIDYMSNGQEYKPKRHETLTWHPSGASVGGWEYSNMHGTLRYVPITAVIGDFYTFTWQMIGHSLLYQREIITYDDSGTGIKETEQYSFLSGNRMQSKQRDTGDLKQKTNWEYPALSRTGTTPEVVRKMVEKHILSPVLSEKQSNSDGYKNEFDEFPIENGDTLILPARLYQTPYAQSVLQSNVLAYSPNGNPREVVAMDGLHTVYLWGYGDRYLIAEIKNATLAQVETAVSAIFGTTSATLAQSTAPDATKLKSLRKHASLSGAHVTVFTHLPLIGVTSITDPSGKTMYYDYDGLGRLKRNYYYEGNVVHESNKRILQEFDYHYRNQ